MMGRGAEADREASGASLTSSHEATRVRAALWVLFRLIRASFSRASFRESPLDCGAIEGGRAGARAVQQDPPEAPALLAASPLPAPHCIYRTSSLPSSRPHHPSLLQHGILAGGTPLHSASFAGHAPIVSLLLATPGVDPSAKDHVRGTQRRLEGRGLPACPTPALLLQAGRTPLDLALSKGRVATTALLLRDPQVAAALAAGCKA